MRHFTTRLVLPGTFLLCLLLAACSSTASTNPNSHGPATPLAQGTVTVTPTSTPAGPAVTPLSANQLAGTCVANNNYSGGDGGYQYGDLIITKPAEILSYPQDQVPDGTSLQHPFQLNDNTGSTTFAHSPEVNPDIQNEGYGFLVCNNSKSQSHTVKGISVSIASFAAYSSQLNSWQPCDGVYSSINGVQGGGCGGAAVFDERVHATFSANAGVGTSATGVVTGTTNNLPALPLSLTPGKGVSVLVSATIPTAPGSYAFTLALLADSFSATNFWTSGSALYAPIAHKWDGQGCTQASMKSQIPTGGSETFYICPA